MTRDDIVEFLKMLDVKNIVTGSDWVKASCPLAPWTHTKGYDKHPSFGISVNLRGLSVWKCFSCTTEANIIERLLFLIGRYRGEYPEAASWFFFSREFYGEEDKQHEGDKWGVYHERQREIIPSSTTSMVSMENFTTMLLEADNNDLLNFLEQRRILMGICFDWNVRWSKEHKALIFPLENHFGIVQIKARLIAQKKHFYVWNGALGLKPGAWFGLSKVWWNDPVWIVEGELDLLRLATLGQRNVISLGGSSISSEAVKNILGPRVILGFDADKAGELATSKFIGLAKGAFAMTKANWSLVGKKDAGDLETKEELDLVIKGMVNI